MASHSRCPRPLSAELAPRIDESSMLYLMLPSIVQSRLPKIPSLRKSISLYSLATRRKFDPCRPGSGSRTLDMAMVLRGATPMEDPAYGIDILNSDDDLANLKRADKGSSATELTENESGIGWKFAHQGLNLLSLSVEESAQLSQNPRFGSPSFARQLYLHALTYLLRGLPSDLTAEEQLRVCSALPLGLSECLQLKTNTGYNPLNIRRGPEIQPSLLHRILASTIVQAFVIFQIILPYLKHIFTAAYQYEREHKISEMLWSQSIETVDTIGKRGLSVIGAIYAVDDGKVGQIIMDTMSWFVEGVAGGIHEGLGEGMVIMGVRRPSSLMEKR